MAGSNVVGSEGRLLHWFHDPTHVILLTRAITFPLSERCILQYFSLDRKLLGSLHRNNCFRLQRTLDVPHRIRCGYRGDANLLHYAKHTWRRKEALVGRESGARRQRRWYGEVAGRKGWPQT